MVNRDHLVDDFPLDYFRETVQKGGALKKVLFKSENSGCIDMVMNPSNSQELFAAVWEFERKAWGAKTGGAESGIWRSVDGGDNWEHLTGSGLPTPPLGKIALITTLEHAVDEALLELLQITPSAPGGHGPT